MTNLWYIFKIYTMAGGLATAAMFAMFVVKQALKHGWSFVVRYFNDVSHDLTWRAIGEYFVMNIAAWPWAQVHWWHIMNLDVETFEAIEHMKKES